MEHEHRFTERFHRDGKLYRTCGQCRHTELEPVQKPRGKADRDD
jgi:hypothetical protein